MMNIGVIGIGGVGGYFGGKLTQLLNREQRGRLKIFFVARGQHLEEIKKNGLILDVDTSVNSDSNESKMICVPTLATDTIAELPPLDLCLICVKVYDLESVLIQLKPKISDKTMILPLLNGVDISERIRKVIPNGIVFPSCVYVGTHIEHPGRVVQRGGSCTIHFGNDPLHSRVDPKLFEILDRAEIKYNWTENPYTEIWSKYIFIAAFGTVTANFNKSLGGVMESKDLSREVKDIMKEICLIASAKRISLPETIIEDSYNKGYKFPYEIKTSFQRDFERRDKPDERDLFGGSIIRMGKEMQITTKTTERLYSSLRRQKPLA